MKRFFSFFIIVASTLAACSKEKNNLVVGSWKRTATAEVADWNTPVSNVSFTPITGCYVEDVFTFTSDGKYKIRNEGNICPFTTTYNYTYNANTAELTYYNTNNSSSSTHTVAELTSTQMILKARVTGTPGVEASFSKLVRIN